MAMGLRLSQWSEGIAAVAAYIAQIYRNKKRIISMLFYWPVQC
jgi:hypothetical protein